jgi:hypothetical protein
VLLILSSPFTTSMEKREVLFFYFVPDTTRDGNDFTSSPEQGHWPLDQSCNDGASAQFHIIELSINIELNPPYYKTLSKGNIGLKLMLSLLFAKRMTVTASVLNQNFKPRFIMRGNKFTIYRYSWIGPVNACPKLQCCSVVFTPYSRIKRNPVVTWTYLVCLTPRVLNKVTWPIDQLQWGSIISTAWHIW